VLALLDVRVRVTGYQPLTVHIEGRVPDALDLGEGRMVGRQGIEP